MNKQKGFGLIETIVALAIFLIIAVTGVTTVLHSYSINRLSQEETQAKLYAQEGIEAVKSIKNQGWTNLIPGTYGLDNSSGYWTLSGSNNTQDQLTRTIIVSEVYRDIDGNIVETGGTLDPDTQKITVDVTWDFTPTRNNSVQLVTYLTNWGKDIGGPPVPSPTPPVTPTPVPSPTPNPSPSPVITTCTQYCASLGTYSTGTCRKNPGDCNKSGETNEAGGNVYCTGGANADTCCCL